MARFRGRWLWLWLWLLVIVAVLVCGNSFDCWHRRPSQCSCFYFCDGFLLPPKRQSFHYYRYRHRRRQNSLDLLPPPPADRLLSSLSPSSESVPASSSPTPFDSNVQALENWLVETVPKASWHSSVKHACFGTSQRGLQWTQSIETTMPWTDPIPVINLPTSKTLQTNKYPSPTWDTELAVALWKECCMGPDSAFWGYTQFVMQGWNASSANAGVADCPPFTAPNALRHWTAEQRLYLFDDSHHLGKSLEDYSDHQLEEWKQKYEALSNDDKSNMTLEQFQWAMETVHSRAFCGPSIQSLFSSSTSIVSLTAPLACAVAGVLYQSNTPDPSPVVLTTLALLAAIPLALTVLSESSSSSSSSSSSAVLLPMIDSANHLNEAGPETTITYDPVTDCFQLYVGPKCIDPITQQLFISYGTKTDAEWLLNYGFLPGVVMQGEDADGVNDAARDRQRKQLAQAFLARNNK